MAFHPYLEFGGNCREAFTRYQEIFGGQLDMMGMADVPMEEELPADRSDLVMHAALSFDGHLLMGSDHMEDGFTGIVGMSVNYTLTDHEEAKRVWEALAEGGEITMALGETFWSPLFGICVDRFGTPWMVNVEPVDT